MIELYLLYFWYVLCMAYLFYLLVSCIFDNWGE